MIEGVEALDSPKNAETELGHEALPDDRGNASKQGVPLARRLGTRKEPWTELNRMESRRRAGKGTSSADKGSKNRSKKKGETWLRSVLENHGGGDKNASSKDRTSSRVRRKVF